MKEQEKKNNEEEVQEEVQEEKKIEERKDGVYFRKDEESEEEQSEEPKEDPKKGQSDEGNPEESKSKEEVDVKKDTEESDIPEQYRGKSNEELVQMIEDGTKKITEQGNVMARYRKELKQSNKDPEEIKKELTANDFKDAITKEQRKLRTLDPDYDKEEYDKQAEVIDALQIDWQEKRQDEMMDKKLNSEKNESFISRQKDKFAEDGVELSDEEYDDVTKGAKAYSQEGVLKEGDYHKALVDKFGLKKVLGFYKIKAEQDVRQSIKKANGNVDKKINLKNSGKNSRFINLKDMSEAEINRAIDGMSKAELKELKQMIN